MDLEYSKKVNKIKEFTLIIAFISGFVGLLLKAFNISTLFLILMTGFSLLLLTKIYYLKIKKIGFVNFLPQGIRDLLLKRSILDLMMDFWHLPVLGKYLKFLFAPIIYNYTPEESIRTIEQLDSKTLKLIQTKGILNILPSSIQSTLKAQEEIRDNDKLVIDDSPNISTKDISKITNIINNKNQIELFDNIINNEVNSNQSMKEEDHSQKRLTLLNLNNSEIDNSDKNLNLIGSNNKIAPMIYYNKSCNEAEYSINNINKKYYKPSEYMLVTLPEIKEDGDKVVYITEDDVFGKKIVFKSIILESSKKIEEEKKNFKPYQWDNLHKFQALKSNKDPLPKFNFYSILKAQIAKSMLTKIKPATVYKSVSAFSLFLLLQILISKKMRNYSVGFIRFIVFSLTSALSTYSLYLIISKLYKEESETNNKTGKKANNLELQIK